METSVLFILFNRPDTTAAVFDAIRKAKPKKLYIAADGPRKGNADDITSCVEVRSIVEHIDWDCQVQKRFLEENAGCRMAVSSAITWFFDCEEEGIILEDDCLPHPSFFSFCETLLAFYRDNHTIMHISGDNFQFGKKHGDADYYFSTIPCVWGWASWRRAWKKYDVSLSDFPAFLKHPKRSTFFLNKTSEYFWLNALYRVSEKPTTWDYQWGYTILKNHGVCVVPQVNLVSNIGFGNKATHPAAKDSVGSNVPTQSLDEIKIHPSKIEIAIEADMYNMNPPFAGPHSRFFITRKKIKKKIKRFLGIGKKK